MPCLHCPAASSHDAACYWKSCPVAVPSQKKGDTIVSEIKKEMRKTGIQPRRRACQEKVLMVSLGDVMLYSCHCNWELNWYTTSILPCVLRVLER